jgi:hypothetical protein
MLVNMLEICPKVVLRRGTRDKGGRCLSSQGRGVLQTSQTTRAWSLTNNNPPYYIHYMHRPTCRLAIPDMVHKTSSKARPFSRGRHLRSGQIVPTWAATVEASRTQPRVLREVIVTRRRIGALNQKNAKLT